MPEQEMNQRKCERNESTKTIIGKAGFQGLRHIDVERFSKEAERATLNSVRTHPSKCSDDGSNYCEDASASIADNHDENHSLITRMMVGQDDLFKHAKSLIMRDSPDNKGVQGKMLAGDSDAEDGNTSLTGNCSESDRCCVEELTGDSGLFALTSSASDTQHNDVVRRNDPDACNERLAVSILDDHRRSFSMNVVDFTLRDNQINALIMIGKTPMQEN